MEKGAFTLDEFLAQMAQVKKLGPMGRAMGLVPGMGDMVRQVNMKEADIERSLNRMKAMYDSMTPAERNRPEMIELRRRRRIAKGSGCEVGEVSTFIRDFEQSRDVMRAVGQMGVIGKLNITNAVRRGDPVLGLVTDRPLARDPSCARREERKRWSIESWWVLLAVALLALMWIYGMTRG